MTDLFSTHSDGSLLAGRYRLEELLGVGAMGSVYRACDELLKEYVALKILLPSLSSDELSVKRFIKEASLTRKINHSNVIRTYDVGMDQSKLFISMELVSGNSLKDIIAKGPLGVNENVAILSETCRGLHAIHEAGIVHRDLKPSNIILADNGFIKIADFGIAHAPFSSDTSRSELVGTAAYMAPEQWSQTELGPKTDLYALGIVAYEICSGIYPFKASNPMEYMYQHLHAIVVPPFEINSDIPSWLNALILQLLSKDPNDRPDSALDVILQLEEGLSRVNAENVPLNSYCQAYEVIDNTIDSDSSDLDPCPASVLGNVGQSISSCKNTSHEPLTGNSSCFLPDDIDLDLDEELQNSPMPKGRLSLGLVLLICTIISGILYYTIESIPFLTGAEQNPPNSMMRLLISAMLSLFPYSLLLSLPVLAISFLVQSAWRSLSNWLIGSALGYLFILVKLSLGPLQAYVKADEASLSQMLVVMKFELGTEISNLIHLMSLSPLQVLSSSTHTSLQNFSFLLYALLIPVLILYCREPNKASNFYLRFVLLFEVLLLSEILVLYVYSGLSTASLYPFEWLNIHVVLGAAAIQIPGLSVFFALVNYSALLLLAYCIRIFESVRS